MHIKEFQELIHTLYFKKDNSRGIVKTTLWLGEEIGELMHELKKPDNEYDNKAIGEELADIVAWTASLANLLSLDLETEIKAKYPDVCIKCNSKPCLCNND